MNDDDIRRALSNAGRVPTRAVPLDDVRLHARRRRASKAGGGAAAVVLMIAATAAIALSQPQRAGVIIAEPTASPRAQVDQSPDVDTAEPTPEGTVATVPPDGETAHPGDEETPEGQESRQDDDETSTDHVAENDPHDDSRVPPEALWERWFASVSITENGQERSLVEGTRIWVGFDQRDERIVWYAGCNATDVSVDISEDRLLLGDDFLSTAIGCSEEHANQDRWVTSFFQSDPFWHAEGDRLWLESGSTRIEFEEDEAYGWRTR